MGQTNMLFVCQGFGCCSLSSAPTDQHVKTNLKLAMIKNICSNTAVTINKTFIVPKPDATATNMDEGHAGLDHCCSTAR